MALFEVDDEGWITQNAGRPPEEQVREVIQNALDTGANIFIGADTRKRQVTVRDYGEGYEKLSDAWTIYGGDKGSDPTKRGRFGRGIKEMVAGAENVLVETTSGAVEFDVVERERIDRGSGTNEGTKVTITNTKWSKEDFEDVKEFVFNLWPPEGQKITTDLKGGSMQKLEHWEPDHTFNAYLDTVKVDNGVLSQTRRKGKVEVKRADGSAGRIYEMGIPVNMDEDMPFYVNVHQKVPMAEQRNEVDTGFGSVLRTIVLNQMYDKLSANELRSEWVQSALDHYKCKNPVKQAYVNKVVKDPGKKGVVTASTNDHYNDKAMNHGYQVAYPEKMASGAASAVKSVCQGARDVSEDLYERKQEQVKPTSEEEGFIEVAEGVADELGYDVEFQVWEIEPTMDGDNDKADYLNGRIRLNRLATDWTEVSKETLGTVVHELSHEHGKGHDMTWVNAMERNFAELLINRW